MQFFHPGFLFALSALAIPIIVHLFNFRRYKTVYFSNVKFLREVKDETTSRTRLKHLLVLATRLLALTFLVLAFAQPFIPNKRNSLSAGKKFVSIYIDNSFSMNAISGGQSLFDKARQTAKEIAKNYSADDQFQLLTNDFQGKHQRMVSKEEFSTLADEIEVSPAVRSLAEITKRQKDALSRENSRNQIAYLLSDFQKNMGDLNIDSAVSYNLVPFAADAQENIYIDTCWFNEPVQLLNQQSQLIVKISNSGEKKSEGNRLALKLNGQAKAMADFSIEPGGSVFDTISFVQNLPGWNKAELSIQDYPITYDDNYFLAYHVIEKINVLDINEGRSNLFLDALFKNQSEFNFNSINSGSFTAQALTGNRLVILDDLKTVSSTLAAALNSYLADGGAVAVFPAGDCEIEAYNRFLNNLQANSITGISDQAQDLAGINLQQNIFRDVFEKIPQNMNLPQARKYYTFSHSSASNEEAILTLKDGSSFFSRYPYKLGSLYVSAVPLDKNFSDLPVHAIFVPMLYKMAVSNIKQSNISYFIGDKTRIEVDAPKLAGDKVYKIKGENVEFIPEQFDMGNKILLGLSDQVKKAGFYEVTLEGIDSSQVLALNFDRRESDLRFYSASQLKDKYTQKNVNVVNAANADVSSVVKELDRGTSLWKLCILLALIFLGIEVLLLRFWRV
jgi:hypothetical protein